MGKETISSIVVRIDERLKNFMEKNKEEHESISKTVKELCDKVNHQVSSFDTRIRVLENKDLETESKYKGRMELYKWTSSILGIVIASFSIAHFLGLI